MGKYLLLILLFGMGCSSCTTSRLINKADKLFHKGAYAEAGRLYREVYQKLSPSQRRLRGYAAFQLAESNRYTGRNLRSMSGYTNAIRYLYPDTTLYFRLGQTYQKDEQYEKAIQEYSAQLSLSPHSQPTLNSIQGRSLAMDGRRIRPVIR
ncbi:MAG: hypothetical protein LIP01_12350 [Tannerellaceae bacterium]|nr:hypothetical protein [Tannerellaceae bacterium]